jgi:RNA polymerase sigma factor (TIGR02999 family)
MSEDAPRLQVAADDSTEARAEERLFATLYGELRRLADRELHRYRGVSVSPTTLVHEAYLNLAGREKNFGDRGKFLGYAARAMRGLVIDFARRRQAVKRGAGFHITQMGTEIGEDVADCEELTRLSEALNQLAALDQRLAEVVDLKYFCGFSFSEIARLRTTSERTVQRDWEKARLLLYGALNER